MSKLKRAVRFEDVPWNRNDDPRDWLNYKRLIWSETGSNDLCIGVGSLDPGRILDLHHHQEDAEFYYVLSGNAKVTVDEEERYAKYRDLQDYIMELCPSIFLYDQVQKHAYQSAYVDWPAARGEVIPVMGYTMFAPTINITQP